VHRLNHAPKQRSINNSSRALIDDVLIGPGINIRVIHNVVIGSYVGDFRFNVRVIDWPYRNRIRDQ
jgi:hypothetical protein